MTRTLLRLSVRNSLTLNEAFQMSATQAPSPHRTCQHRRERTEFMTRVHMTGLATTVDLSNVDVNWGWFRQMLMTFSSPVRNHSRVNALQTLERTSDGVYRVDRNTSFMSVVPRNLVHCGRCDSDEHFHRSNDSDASVGADRPSRGWHMKRAVQGRLSEYSQDAKNDQNTASAISPKQSDAERSIPDVGHSSAVPPSDVSAPSGKDGIHDKSSHDRSGHHSGFVQRRRKLGVVQTDVDEEWIISRQHYELDALGKAIQNSCLGVLQRHRRPCSVHSEQDSVDEETSSLTNRSQSQESSKLCNSSDKLPIPETDSGTRPANLFAKLCSAPGAVKSSEQIESRCKSDESPGSA
ncbi:uncharacterized protein DEA37_0001713 [Paragonimus westermani]|uniref:Uncharacterized protein n=1 Tax=Paragonimus westermani TaxID=34504 RepID=A0A5J4NJJ8_9TREM|nr:uncharacterized protein DEA37_0001713 [Paragonimus westermani]